jgi:hypothetical protein
VRVDQIDIHLHPLRLCALLDLPAISVAHMILCGPI